MEGKKREDGARNTQKDGKDLSDEEAAEQWRLKQAEDLLKEMGYQNTGNGWKKKE